MRDGKLTSGSINRIEGKRIEDHKKNAISVLTSENSSRLNSQIPHQGRGDV